MSITDNLTQKLGPLPVWVWGLGGAATVIVGRQLLAARNTSDQVPVDDAGLETVGGGGLSGVPSAAVPSNPAGWNGAPADPVGVGQDASLIPPTTNEEWRSRAIDKVPKNYGTSASLVATAIDKWFAGSALTASEENTVNNAVALLNYPPAGAPSITRVSPNPQTPAQPPPPQAPPVYTPPSGPPVTAAPKNKFRVVITSAQLGGRVVQDKEVTTAAEVQAIRAPYDAANGRIAQGIDWGEGGPYTISVT